MENKFRRNPIAGYILLAAGLILAILNFEQILSAARTIWRVMLPLVSGLGIAYVLNIVMKGLDRCFFPGSAKKWVRRARKPVCLFLSYVFVFLALFLIVNLVLPEIINTITVIVSAFPAAMENLNEWLLAHRDQLPVLANQIGIVNVDWESLVNRGISLMTQSISGILSSSLNLLTVLAAGVFSAFVAIAFSFFPLWGKEKLLAQFRRLQAAFLPEKTSKTLNTVLATANATFSSFIVGQVTEAVVLGLLCTAGMWIFKFPFATTIGVFVGATALIPVFGAYLGAAVGAFLILTTDPMKALFFLIFIVVLQQIEGNLIYPRVVGSSIGLPGIWVFVAVVIGGGLFGVIGMLLGVPLTATAYKLIRMALAARERGSA